MDVLLKIIAAPIATMIVVQAIKLATDGIKGNFNIKSFLTTYGGMPSGHAAYVTALSVSVGLYVGFTDPLFGVAVVFSLLVISDAMFLRRRIDLVAKATNNLIVELPEDQRRTFSHLNTRIEHSFGQIVVGGLCGGAIAVLIYLIF